MKLIKSPAQQRWVRDSFACGMQVAVNAAYAKVAPFERAYRFFAQLEDAGVLRQWQILTDDDYYDLEDPSSGAPLFIAGERWDEFVREAQSLGLPTEAPDHHG